MAIPTSNLNVLSNILLLVALSSVPPTPADAQDVAPNGFRFHRDEDNVVCAVEFWGGNKLRSGSLHKLNKLSHLVISYGTHVTKPDVNYLSTLGRIESLQIGQELIDEPVTIDGGISSLGKLKSLESVHLCKHDIRDDDLKFIASLPKLAYLEFNADSGIRSDKWALTDAAGKFVAQAAGLECIWIQGHGKLTDRFVSQITKGLPNLEELRFYNPNLTDNSLQSLAENSVKLRSLSVASPQFTNRGIKFISSARELRELSVASPKLTSACLDSIAQMKHLSSLELTVPSIDDDDAKTIASIAGLETLALRNLAMTNAQFGSFQNHSTLKSAFINGKKMTVENTLSVIKTIPHLKHLSVGSRNADLQAAVDQYMSRKGKRTH